MAEGDSRPEGANLPNLEVLNETWIGTNVVQEDSSVILTDNLLEMLAELKKTE